MDVVSGVFNVAPLNRGHPETFNGSAYPRNPYRTGISVAESGSKDKDDREVGELINDPHNPILRIPDDFGASKERTRMR